MRLLRPTAATAPGEVARAQSRGGTRLLFWCDVRWLRTPSVLPLPVAALHLGALSSLAVAEPLFDLISKNPDFLVARALIGWQVVGLGLVLVLAPPLLTLGVEALVGVVSRPARAVVHLFFVSLVRRADCDPGAEGHRLGASSGVLIAIAASLGVLAAVAYAKARSGLRSFVTVLSPAPVLFLAVFLFFSPVSDLTFASGHGRDRRRQLACSRRHGRVRRGLHDRVRGLPTSGSSRVLYPESGRPHQVTHLVPVRVRRPPT